MLFYPNKKYDREGGPRVSQFLGLIQNHALQPAANYLLFIRRLIFNYLIGNCDAHGKNYSMLYRGNQPILAPTYDLLSTVICPDLSSKMAMKIGGKYDPETIFLRHWHQLVPGTSGSKKDINKELIELSKNCFKQANTLNETLKEKHIYSPIFDEICKVIKKHTTYILSQT